MFYYILLIIFYMYLIILNTNIQIKYGVIIMYNVVKSNT